MSVKLKKKEIKLKYNELTKDIEKNALKILKVIMPRKVITLTKKFGDLPMFGNINDQVSGNLFDDYDPKQDEGLKKVYKQYNHDVLSHTSGSSSSSSDDETTRRRKRKKRKLNNDKSKKDNNNNNNNNNNNEKKDINDDGYHPPSYDYLKSGNKKLLSLLSDLKNEMLEFLEYMSTIKMYIQLKVPEIEDGNNFGVTVQEEAISEVSRAEDTAFGVIEVMAKYHIARARIMSKVVKYPRIEDYRQSVVEVDEKTWTNAQMFCLDLRNSYVVLHDKIIKNIDKIMMPRSENKDVLLY